MLKEAGMTLNEIDNILLLGGSQKIPKVKEMIEEKLEAEYLREQKENYDKHIETGKELVEVNKVRTSDWIRAEKVIAKGTALLAYRFQISKVPTDRFAECEKLRKLPKRKQIIEFQQVQKRK